MAKAIYETEFNVPVPPNPWGPGNGMAGSDKYGLADLKKNETRFIPGGDPKRVRGTISSYIGRWKKRHPNSEPPRFIVRANQVNGNGQTGVRIWRNYGPSK